MTDQPLTCPYCNAQVPLPPGLQAGRRVECPTCGEAFALQGSEAVIAGRTAVASSPAAAPGQPAAALPVPDVSQDPGQVRRTNRRMAALIVAVMLGMACTGLVFALVTWRERRSHDTGLTGGPKRSPVPIENESTEVPPLAPDKLPALGYLPRGTDFVLAARVVELQQSQTGKRLLEEPLRFGERSRKLADVAAMVGLEMEQIDHLVLGLKLENILPPWLNVVIRTRQPYDAAELRGRLKAKMAVHEGKKPIYRFQPPQSPVSLFVWFADEHTLVLGLDASQVEAALEPPRTDLSQLSEELQVVLHEHRPATAPLWITGHSRDWSRTMVRPLLERLAQKSWQRLRDVPTLAAWVELNGSIRTQVVLHGKDEPAARKLEQYLGTAVPADAGKAAVAREKDWVLLQLKTDPTVLQRILEK